MKSTAFKKKLNGVKNCFALQSTVIGFIFYFSQTISAAWAPTSLNDKSVQAIVKCGNQIFVGTENFGVFTSLDNGASWVATNNGLPENISVLSFASCRDTVLAGASNGYVFYFTNKTKSWKNLGNRITDTSVISLAVMDEKFFAGTVNRGVFLFNKDSQQWKMVNSGLNPNSPVNALAVVCDTIFAVNNRSIYFSLNYGTRWVESRNGIPTNTTVALKANGSTLYAGTVNNGVYISSNSGASWKPLNTSLSPGFSNVQEVAVGRGVLFAVNSGSGVFFFMDSAATWKSIGDNLSNLILSITICDDFVFVGTQRGLFRRPFSDIIPVTNSLKVYASYEMPVTFYSFTWDMVSGAASYELYANDVPFVNVQDNRSASHINAHTLLDLINSKTGGSVNVSDTVQFYMVARSATNQIVKISNVVHFKYDFLIQTRSPGVGNKNPQVHIPGSSINFQLPNGEAQLSLYSLDGVRVSTEKDIRAGNLFISPLSQGVYVVKLNGSRKNGNCSILPISSLLTLEH